jgi:hypothetical protein
MIGVDVSTLFIELYERIPPLAREVVDGMDPNQLLERPTPDANSIAWLIWHLARVQDHHVAEILGTAQIWTEDTWASRFGLSPDAGNIGYGHSSEEVATVRPDDPEVLLEYLAAVYQRSRTMLAQLTADDLDRIVDRRWDPPVTLGVRLVSIADDSLQHVGQAAYVRGLLGA